MTFVIAKVRISGRVQGVWFHQSPKEKAAELGVSGGDRRWQRLIRPMLNG